MLKYINFLTAFFLIVSSLFAQNEEVYEIKVKIPQLTDTTCYLANYYGDKQYYKDTSRFNNKGVCTFKSKEPLPGGIYSVILPNNSYFEFIVNEPEIYLESDTNNLADRMIVHKSDENKLFLEYMNFLKGQTQKAMPLRKELNGLKNKSGKKAKKLREKLSAIDQEVKEYQKNIIDKHPDTFLSVFIKAMQEIEIPETNEAEEDPGYRARYYKKHYWDNVDLTDARLLRSPVFHKKLDQYFKKVVPKHPDSVIAAAEQLIDEVEGDKDLFKYVIHYLTNTSERSKIMGMDAVFVHMAENYYAKGKAYWADSSSVKKITERGKTLKPLLIGKTAHNLGLADKDENWHKLHDIEAPLTILVFWDPDCGHCKKVMPKLAEIYGKEMKNKGVKVYSVSSDHNKSWRNFVEKHNMEEFINVAVPKELYEDGNLATKLVMEGKTDSKSLNYTQTFDIYATPQIYILGEDKKIIAKKIDVDQVKDVVNRHMDEKE